MKPKHKRLIIILASILSISSGAFLLFYNMRNSMVFFYPPSEILINKIFAKTIRAGGLVKQDSLKASGNNYKFIITDYAAEITVEYTGVLPDLFKEGQGVVAQGEFKDGVFQAEIILAKHDENYMPPEIHRSLKNAKEKK